VIFLYFCAILRIFFWCVMGIKRVIQDRKLASIGSLKQRGRWRPGENSLQLVGLILCLEDVSEIKSLKRMQTLFKGMGAVCYSCIYQKNTRIEIPDGLIDEHTVLLDRKSTNWYGLVRPGLADVFLRESFDMVLNLSKEFFFTTTCLASLSKAALKIGRYESPQNPYCIVLEVNQDDNDKAFMVLLNSVLQIIRFE